MAPTAVLRRIFKRFMRIRLSQNIEDSMVDTACELAERWNMPIGEAIDLVQLLFSGML